LQTHFFLVATSVGNLALFASGSLCGTYLLVVDIYDALPDMWNVASTPMPLATLLLLASSLLLLLPLQGHALAVNLNLYIIRR
jgi:hypothetical protein